MEGHVAVGLGALDAGPAPLPAQVAGELPAGRGDLPDPVDRLQEDRVGKLDLRDPERAHHVGPPPLHRLLEGPAFARAQDAVDGPGRGLEAAPAEPLALGDVRHPVAFLVDGQVAHVAEEDGVGVVALPVVADAADGVLVDVVRVPSPPPVLPDAPHLEEALLLEAVHEDLEGLLRDGREALALAVLVHQGEPLVVLFVHIVLHHIVQVLGRLLHEAVVGRVAGWGVRILQVIEDGEVGHQAAQGALRGGRGRRVFGGVLFRAPLPFVLRRGLARALGSLALGPPLRCARARRALGGGRRVRVDGVLSGGGGCSPCRFGGLFSRRLFPAVGFLVLVVAGEDRVQVVIDLDAVVLVVELHLHHPLGFGPCEVPPDPPPHDPARGTRGTVRCAPDGGTTFPSPGPAPGNLGRGSDLTEVVHDPRQAAVRLQTRGAFERRVVASYGSGYLCKVELFVLHVRRFVCLRSNKSLFKVSQ